MSEWAEMNLLYAVGNEGVESPCFIFLCNRKPLLVFQVLMLPIFTETTTAVNSNLGIVVTFVGDTGDSPITRAQ